MTTSLPPTSPETPLASTATSTAAVNGLLDLLSGATPPLAPGETAATADFAQLLPATPAAAVVAAPAALPAAAPVAATGATNSTPAPQAASLPSGVRSVVLRAPTAAADLTATDAPEDVTSPLEAAPTAPTLPERATLEAALALLLPFAPTVAPVAPVQPAPGEAAPRPAPTGATELPVSPESAPAATYRVTLAVPGRAPVEVVLPVTPDRLPDAEIATALAAELGGAAEFSVPRRAAPAPSIAPASQPIPGTYSQPQAAAASPTALIDSMVELPGGARVTIAVSAPPTTPTPVASRPASLLPEAVATALPTQSVPAATERMPSSENSAASAAPIFLGKNAPRNSPEKNFLSAAKPSVTPSREEAGIGVAQMSSAMPLSSSAPIAPAHAAAPVAALVEKLSAPVPAEAPVLTPASASAAHRAVETVTQVVESQAASRLQPVPSVQLRFKVGGEDLAVRVELRNGEVRTEFKTDNAELRAALAQEWRAVTGRADSAVRFLEPVITPANAAGQGSGSFSSQQHSSSQHQQQAQQQFRAQAELFGSVGRSFGPAVESAPASSVVTPLVLPTSQRLSAVA